MGTSDLTHSVNIVISRTVKCNSSADKKVTLNFFYVLLDVTNGQEVTYEDVHIFSGVSLRRRMTISRVSTRWTLNVLGCLVTKQL